MENAELARQLPSRRAAPRNQRTLLLIDDDPQCARFVAHAAEELGYDAHITISHGSFQARYGEVEPDIVVLDLAMPGADGVELLRFLANERCTALVIIISGFDRRVVDAAMRLGVALGLRMGTSLTKPVVFKQLGEALEGGSKSPFSVA